MVGRPHPRLEALRQHRRMQPALCRQTTTLGRQPTTLSPHIHSWVDHLLGQGTICVDCTMIQVIMSVKAPLMNRLHPGLGVVRQHYQLHPALRRQALVRRHLEATLEVRLCSSMTPSFGTSFVITMG